MIDCVDVWWPGACTQPVLDAYKALIRAGNIVIRRVEVGRFSGRITVRYQADRPQEQIRALLWWAKEGRDAPNQLHHL